MGVDWESHPLWAGVLTGGLLLVAGYFGVETFLRERDAGKWEQVANIAFKAVGVSTGLLRDGMDLATCSVNELRHGEGWRELDATEVAERFAVR